MTCKVEKCLDIKNCERKKCLFCKLLSACKEEISNTTETSLVEKK